MNSVKSENNYSLKVIDFGKGVPLNSKVTEERVLLVKKFMENNCLFSYIAYQGEGFPEDLARLLFYKILKSIQECHN